MIDVLKSVFFLILHLSDIASFLLICSISKSSRAGNCLLSARRIYLSKLINDLVLFLVSPFKSSMNQGDLSSKYTKLQMYISRLIKILSAIEVISHLSKSFLSIFQSAFMFNRYKSQTIYDSFYVVSWPIMMLFIF